MSATSTGFALNAEELFGRASKDFRNSLSPHDAVKFKEFATADEMIRELRRDASNAESGRLHTICRRIEAVSISLSPFFDTVGIFVSSHPEIAALVWGAIRMVFLLSSNYTTFLEKLLAMLEKISYRLPGYAEYYQKLVDRRRKNLMDDSDLSSLSSNRVALVLSYIYSDITQFCQEACKPFSTRKRGIRYKTSVIADVFWRPFDLRFKDILQRLEEHHSLFQSEFLMEESKYTEVQYRRRQQEAGVANAAAMRIQEQLEALESEIHTMENSLSAKFAQLSWQFQRRTMGRSSATDAQSSTGQTTLFDVQLRRIKKWLNAPQYSEEFQKAQNARFPDTCRWFLANPIYQRFKKHRLELLDSTTPFILAERMLFVKGKPGYGKTVLSSLLIDDLNFEDDNTEPTLVLYYHFVSARSNESGPTHGLRAVLHQFIHQNRNRADVMDAISVLIESEDSGELCATNNEVFQCLVLLLKYIPDTTLVLDGVDECSDTESLLQQVQRLCSDSPTKVLFLGRPSVDLPSGIKRCGIVRLEPWENEEDIRAYLQPKVFNFHQLKLLPATSDCDEVSLILATRSQGMFLWAKLMISYLSDKSLTPRERHDTIHAADVLNGIEELYDGILKLLSQNSEARKRKIKRIFQIMVSTRSPLRVAELQWMTAVVPGRVTTEDDLIVDFEETLPLIMGALVELDSQYSVLFVHSSLRDYLLDTDESNKSGFAICVLTATFTLVSICISYLTYDIPRSQITKDKDSRDYRKSLDQNFPLLKYALHLVNNYEHAGATGSDGSNTPVGDSVRQLVEATSGWLREKICIQAWIECSYYFDLTPSVALILHLLKSYPYNPWNEPGSVITHKLEDLGNDLSKLIRDWSQVLTREPSAIWTSTITAFTKSEFWPESDNTTIIPLTYSATKEAHDNVEGSSSNTILLMSHVSQEGNLNGIAHLHPSRSYRNLAFSSGESQAEMKSRSARDPRSAQLPQSAYSGWRLEYQIISLDTQKVVLCHIFDLQADEVFEALNMPLPTEHDANESWRFRFPITISRELDKLIVLRTVIRVPLALDYAGNIKQSLGPATTQHLKHHDDLSRVTYKRTYRVEFSPSEDALAIVEVGSDDKLLPQVLEIWSQDNNSTDYVFRGRHQVARIEIGHNLRSKDFFLFHPTLPAVVLAEWGRAALWWYMDQGLERRQFFISRMIQPLMIKGNTLVYYCHAVKSKSPLISDLTERRVDNFPSRQATTVRSGTPPEQTEKGSKQRLPRNGVDDDTIISMGEERMPVSDTGKFDLQPLIDAHILEHLPSQEPRERDQETQSVTSATGGLGLAQSHDASKLQQKRLFALQGGDNSQDVIIRTRRGRIMKYGHFPATSSGGKTSVGLLPSQEFRSTVRVVWNQEAQESYSVLDKQSEYLPSIIERSRAGLLALQGDDDKSSRGTTEQKGLLTDSDTSAMTTVREEREMIRVIQEPGIAEVKRSGESESAEASTSQARRKRVRRGPSPEGR